MDGFAVPTRHTRHITTARGFCLHIKRDVDSVPLIFLDFCPLSLYNDSCLDKKFGEVCMKKMMLVLTLLLALVSVCSFAETLQSDAIRVASLKNLLNDEYAPYASIYQNRDLDIEKSGICVSIAVGAERTLLSFNTVWRIKKQIPEARLALLLNKWNFNKFFTTAYSYEEYVALEYHMCYDGGINTENFNGTLDVIFEMVELFREYLQDAKVLDK